MWFFVVSTKKQYSSILEIEDSILQEIVLIMKKVRQWMKEILNIDIVYIFQNEDSTHWFHIWMFPKHNWMKSFKNKIEWVKDIMNYAEENMTTQEQVQKVNNAILVMKAYLAKD